MTERRLQHDILKALGALDGVRVWRAGVGAAPMPSGKYVRFGTPGQPDILGIVERRLEDSEGCKRLFGVLLAIEVKSEKGRLSKTQAAFKEMLEDHGAVYILARDVKSTVDRVRLLAGR